MVALVKVYWRTDAAGYPVDPKADLEEGPIGYYGPFPNVDEASEWMETSAPDDPDIRAMHADDFHLEEDVYINPPEEIFGDIPDDDIRVDEDPY